MAPIVIPSREGRNCQNESRLYWVQQRRCLRRRFRHQRRRRRRNGNDSMGKLGGGAFTPHEVRELTEYLTRYRDLTLDAAAGASSRNGKSTSKHPMATIVTTTTTTPLAGHEFPSLEVPIHVEAPYLMLPLTLSRSARGFLHRLCPHLGLYHSSIDIDVNVVENNDGNDDTTTTINGNSKCSLMKEGQGRIFVVSSRLGGFDELVATRVMEAPGRLPLEIRPWYYEFGIYRKCSEKDDDADDDMDGELKEDMTSRTQRMLETIRELEAHPSSVIVTSVSWRIDEDLSNLPPFFPILINDVEGLRRCAEDLRRCTKLDRNIPGGLLAVDVEMYNPSKYFGATCLLQLAGGHEDDVLDCQQRGVENEDAIDENDDERGGAGRGHVCYVIDVLAPGVWSAVRDHLTDLFHDPGVTVVGHAIGGMDVGALHRDFGLFVINAFDTYEASRALGLGGGSNIGLGLAALCRHYGLPSDQATEFENLKAIYQKVDWRHRPLTEAMVRYGSSDVRCLLPLRRLLVRDLAQQDECERQDRNLVFNGHDTGGSGQLVPSGVAMTTAAVGMMMMDDDDDDEINVWETPRQHHLEIDDDDDKKHDALSRPSHPTFSTTSDNANVSTFYTPRENEEDDDDDGDSMDNDSGAVTIGKDIQENNYPTTPSTSIKKEGDRSVVTMTASELCRDVPSLMTLLAECQRLCTRIWVHKDESWAEHPKLLFARSVGGIEDGDEHTKGQNLSRPFPMFRTWDGNNVRLYQRLIEWRAEVALREKISPYAVCDTEFLVDVAWHRPTTVDRLRSINYFLNLTVERWTDELLALVREDDDACAHRRGDDFPSYQHSYVKALAAVALVAVLAVSFFRTRPRHG